MSWPASRRGRRSPPDPGAQEDAVGQALARDRQVLKLRAEAAELEKLLAETLERSRLKEKDPDV
jgi:hypothetical protein